MIGAASWASAPHKWASPDMAGRVGQRLVNAAKEDSLEREEKAYLPAPANESSFYFISPITYRSHSRVQLGLPFEAAFFFEATLPGVATGESSWSTGTSSETIERKPIMESIAFSALSVQTERCASMFEVPKITPITIGVSMLKVEGRQGDTRAKWTGR